MRAAYHRRLTGADRQAQIAAATAWSLWEARTSSLLPQPLDGIGFGEPHFALAFARIESHFFTHGAWLEEGQLIRDAGLLKSIPGTIIQGRYDMVCPMRTAYDLHRAWPEADFRIVPDAGHSWLEPGTLDQVVSAIGRYAD